MSGYIQERHTIKDVLRLAGRDGTDNLNSHSQKVMGRIKACRSATLGYHLYRCNDAQCGSLKYQYHSCRDRHCPMCGALKKEEWIEARTRELLPVPYYHAVFTLPHELNSLVMGNRTVLYNLLFNASAATLLGFAKDTQWMGATPGIISVLHTWGQQLSFHPHVHCIVSGGGMDKRQKWIEGKRTKDNFLFPTKAMAIVYRAKYLQGIKLLMAKGSLKIPQNLDICQLLSSLYRKSWVVYAKQPWGGPAQVVEYLGRYTHKVAISNHRIKNIDPEKKKITFAWKDYGDNNANKMMTLSADEFIRRFAQHILPKGFTRIRSYGYLANRGRQNRINSVLEGLNLPIHPQTVKIPLEIRLKEKYALDMYQCSCCDKGRLEIVAVRYFNIRSRDG